ncbi:MAG: thiamine diphosphokinase [Lactobacillus sp.]|jgi:thiamine pyrophosphokinase|nr:thiamine diphosphokinase [Lactobacillus sp.]
MPIFKQGIAVLGGPKEQRPRDFQAKIKAAKAAEQMLIGVDRGSLFCLEAGVVPDLAVGDFDSLTSSELSRVEQAVSELRYSKPEKDLTDSELMLSAALLDYDLQHLQIIGATGGRLDHFLVNLFMINRPVFRPFAERISLLDQQNLVEFYLPGQHQLWPKQGYPYLGITPLEVVHNLTIQGAKYDLQSYSTAWPCCFSSNEFNGSDPIKLEFETGLVAVIYSRD